MIGFFLRNRAALIALALLLLGAIGLGMVRRAGRVECEAEQKVDQAKQETRAAKTQEELTHDAIRRDDELAARRRKIDTSLVEARQHVDAARDLGALADGYVAHVERMRRDAANAHAQAVSDYRRSVEP